MNDILSKSISYQKMDTIQFALIGHVDSGKSTLAGQILNHAKYISSRELEVIFKKSEEDGMERWKWARILDIFEEELSRGKTHEFAKIDFEIDNQKYRLIDTPGHSIFIRSMIEGIYGINIAVVIIPMINTEFESVFKGSLKEHLIISRVSGVKKIVLIANKMDAIDWNQDVYIEKTTIVKEFLHKVGYTSSDIISVPISAYQGICLFNLDNMPSWYIGPTFIEALDIISKGNIDSSVSVNFTGNNFVIDTRIINYDQIITLGFTAIIHNSGIEYTTELIGIKNETGCKFIKNGDKCYTIWKFSQEITITDDKVLIRKGESTIGLGKIVKSIKI